MSTTRSVPSRGRRHPVRAMTEARRLHKSGWSDTDIAEQLFADGFVTEPVSKATVGRWVKRKRAKSWLADIEKRNGAISNARGSQPMGNSKARPEFKIGRIVALRGCGMSVVNIARVMAFDFQEPWTDRHVREVLEHGTYPRRLPS